MSQLSAPHWLCPTDSSWQQSFLLCLYLPASYHQPGRAFCFSGEEALQDCPSGSMEKLAHLGQRKLLSVFCCHPLPSMLPFRMDSCALGASLAVIFFQKYSAFSKKYSVISFSITAVWFWFKLLPEYSEGWDHHTVSCAVVEEKARSVYFLQFEFLSTLTGRYGNRPEIWELRRNSPS